jgi:hypothetical protein
VDLLLKKFGDKGYIVEKVFKEKSFADVGDY